MMQLIALKGADGEFPAIYANPLGFSAAGQGMAGPSRFPPIEATQA